MNKPSFLPEKEEQKQSKKGDYKSKCTEVLEKIKAIDEGKYHELNTVFHSRYYKDNIRKNVIIGFYGQLVNEFKALQPSDATPMVAPPKKAKPIKKVVTVKKEETKKVVKETAKEEIKKVAKKTAKKETKKVAKKTTKKETKKVAKKTAKKETKKVAKKTTKKVAKKVAKKTTTKKTTKKVAKKATKKTTKKR